MNIKTIGVFLGLIGALIVSGMFLISQMEEPIIQTKIMQEQRKAVLVTADANPGDNSGFFYFQIRPHNSSHDPWSYNESNSTAYEFSDEGNVSCTGDTPYSTTFDILCKVGVTNEDGYWTGNQSLNEDYFYLWMASEGAVSFGPITDNNATEQFIGNTTDYAWYHYYMNNSGTGYQISEGQWYNVTCQFYVMRIV